MSEIYELHIAGPDDVHTFEDELVALRQANTINQGYLKRRLQWGDDEPLCVATVTPVSREGNTP